MKNKKLRLGLLLFLLGMIGGLSILTMDIPLPPEAQAILKDFSPLQIKLLLLVNPLIMVSIATLIGTLLYQKVNLRVPILERMVGIDTTDSDIPGLLKYGVVGGLIAGVLLSLVGLLFTPILPEEFVKLGETLKPTLAARFLYGGLTEEILMRFGLMTLVVWIASKIFEGQRPVIYWIGIIIASFVFALGHLPIVFQSVGVPSMGLVSYILIGNVIGGVIFGWLYWKKGLESAFLAHIFAHVVMVLAESIAS